jgi:hypothetical protein
MASAWGQGSAWAQTQQPAAQAQKTPNWKDRAEYDLVQSALAEKDPQKRLDLLTQWKDKYPETDFKEMRVEAFLAAYQGLNQTDKVLATAKDLMDMDPKNVQALYWVALLTVSTQQTSPAGLDLGQKAANGLLTAEKPAQVTDEAAWEKSKAQMVILGHRTLGWIANQRKDYPTAETELLAELKLNPGDSEAAYWLASALRAQAAADSKPELFSLALFYYGRGAAYDGPGGFDAARRKQLESWLQKAYTDYHGADPEGFQALLAAAKAGAVPPDGFVIKSSGEIEADRLKALQASSPALAMWVNIKGQLTADGGDSYFASSMKEALVPPEGQPSFQAKVISEEPARAPKTVRVSIEDGKTVDAILVFDVPLARPADPGTTITFRGVPTAFTKAPFTVTFDVEKKNVTGWPAPPPPKKAVVHKKQAD